MLFSRAITSYNHHTMGSMGQNARLATEPIAIIGMSCKFGGDASNPDKLWDMLAEGKSAWSEVPMSRYGHRGQYYPENSKLSTVRETVLGL